MSSIQANGRQNDEDMQWLGLEAEGYENVLKKFIGGQLIPDEEGEGKE